MRLFQSQTLPSEPEQSDPELDLDRKVKLLKQTSHIVKEKGHRVATPDKVPVYFLFVIDRLILVLKEINFIFIIINLIKAIMTT